jgi:hypothetical protein
MSTIVMNTLNGAVTEYDWAFQSITAGWLGDATGLYSIGGDDDDGAVIAPDVMSGEILLGDARKMRIDNIWYSMASSGDTATAVIESRGNSYQYAFPVTDKGVSRAEPGKGLNMNYAAVGFTNDGADFRIDRIEIDVKTSTTRRMGS